MKNCFLIMGLFTAVTMQAQKPYRDLNKNGKMDDYENPSLSAEKRAASLLSLMTPEEKAGEMFHTYAMVEKDGSVSNQTFMTHGIRVDSLIIKNRMTHFNLIGDASGKALAHYTNSLQKVAEQTRLGIPVTFSTDPRNGFKKGDFNTTASSVDLTAFPEPLGMAATGDSLLVNQYAKAIAEEYRAVGITCGLHPMTDLATEPRWPRITATMGEDPVLASKLLVAYIKGFQGNKIDNNSVWCVAKHFPGSGPQKEGWESHFSYGKNLAYPGNNFKYHLITVKAVIKAGVVGVMTAYGIPAGQTGEEVGASFNRTLIDTILKKELGFKGIVISDWNTITDKYMGSMKIVEARGWGVESLSKEEKIVKQLNAGVDQIGGETETETIANLVKEGKLPQEMIDRSVFKILKVKFELGLFDNPYVNEDKVAEHVGTPAHLQLSKIAQEKSLVLLSNKQGALPAQRGQKIYIEGFDKKAFEPYGTVTDKIEDADFAVLHLQTPYSPPRSNSMLEMHFHQGRLDFSDSAKAVILNKLKTKPCIVVINIERAAVIPEIAENAAGLFADFGISDSVMASGIFGAFKPSGKLPIELPSSMDAVQEQKEDVPYDSKNPLFKFGFGLQSF